MAENVQGCKAKRRDGSPCRGKARPSGYCFAHDPELQTARQQGSKKGGQGRAKVVRLRRVLPADLARIFGQLETAMREVYSGDLEPKVGTAMASLASAMCKVLESGELRHEVDQLKERLEKWG